MENTHNIAEAAKYLGFKVKTFQNEYCLNGGLSNAEYISEIGGGLNFERKKFLEIMNAVERREVKMLIIAHKDRLARFGFEYFRYFLSKHNCELVILNNDRASQGI